MEIALRPAKETDEPHGEDVGLKIGEGRKPVTSARSNLPTIRHVLAEHTSAQTGGTWVAVEEQVPG